MDFVNRFLKFDKLMGATLVKIVYYLGLVGIILGVLGAILASAGTMQYMGVGAFLGTVVGAPIAGLIAICFLRFACELYIVVFRIGDDISAMRAGGGSIAPKTPPTSV